MDVFAGGQDKQGRAILTFPCHESPDKLRYEDLLRLLSYLRKVPRSVSSHIQSTRHWSKFGLHNNPDKNLCKAYMSKEHSETTCILSVFIAKGFWQPVLQSKTRLQYRTPSKQAKYWLVKMHCKPHNITGKIPSLWPNVVLCLIVIVVSHAHR